MKLRNILYFVIVIILIFATTVDAQNTLKQTASRKQLSLGKQTPAASVCM